MNVSFTRREFVVAGAIATSSVSYPKSVEQPSCLGTWTGGFSDDGGYTAVELSVSPEGSVVSSFRLKLSKVPIEALCSESNLSFTFDAAGTQGSFKGRLTADRISGLLSLKSRSFKADLIRTGSAKVEHYGELLGAYLTTDRQLISVGRIPFSNKLAVTNYATGELRTLFPAPDGSYFTGPSYGVPVPPALHYLRSKDGWIISKPGSGPIAKALPAAATASEIEFTTDDEIKLMGTLRLPRGEGPFPLVVFAHGSGPADRHGFLSLQYLLPEWGIATLAFDKRGGGASGGTYVHRFEKENFERLAKDLVSAVQFGRGAGKIDPQRVGIVGISQAGWVVPIAADLLGDLKTTVLISGPPVAWGLENAYSVLTDDGSGNSKLSQHEVERRIALASPTGFDPQDYIKSMNIPGLWLFGGHDQSVPARLCVSAIDQLRSAGFRNLHSKLYPAGNHALWECERGTLAEFPLVKRYVPGFFDDLHRWLDTHLIA